MKNTIDNVGKSSPATTLRNCIASIPIIRACSVQHLNLVDAFMTPRHLPSARSSDLRIKPPPAQWILEVVGWKLCERGRNDSCWFSSQELLGSLLPESRNLGQTKPGRLRELFRLVTSRPCRTAIANIRLKPVCL